MLSAQAEGLQQITGRAGVTKLVVDTDAAHYGGLLFSQQAGNALAEAGINAMIINMATIKPLDEELVIEAAKKCGKIITCEEHSVIGGLGEAVCSFLSETYPTPVKRIGVQDKFGFSGPANEVLDAFGLSARNIVEVTKEFLGK